MQLISNTIPILIELLSVTRVHVFEMIITIEMCIANPLFDDFSAFII